MKTLIVIFFATASVAVGAPALEENFFEDMGRLQNKQYQLHSSILEHVTREKKAPPPSSFDIILHAPTTTLPIADDESTGRNSLKKPLIIKKKIGHRLFRDSEDEKSNANSQETCGRQVNLKVCDEDGKIREMLRNTAHEISDAHTTEDNIQNSIKMARDVVENLQRDLGEVEIDNPDMKQAQNSESHNKLRLDIEEAKKKLERVLQEIGLKGGIGVFGPYNRDSNAMRDDDHDNDVKILQTENEKMAQRKEADDNIKQNAEIATKIEDGVKTVDHLENLVPISQTSSWQIQTKSEQVAENNDSNKDIRDEQSSSQTQSAHTDDNKKTVENRKEQSSDGDMEPSASENIEMKAIDIKNNQPLRSENQEQKQEFLTSSFHNTKSSEEDHSLRKSSVTHLNVPIINQQQKQNVQDNSQLNDSGDKSDASMAHSITENKEIKKKLIADNTKLDNTRKSMIMYEEKLKNHKEKSSDESLQPKETPEQTEDSKNFKKSVDEMNLQKMSNVIQQSNKFTESATHTDHEDPKMDLNKSDNPLSISLIDNVRLKTLPTDSEQLQHFRKEAGLEKNIDNNEKEETLTKMKSVEDNFHLTDFITIDDQQDNLMKSADNTLKMDKNLNIDYNETEHEKLTKAAEDDFYLTKLIKIAQNNENLMKTAYHASSEQNKEDQIGLDHKETLGKVKLVEDHSQVNKLRKTGDGNELFMEKSDDDRQGPIQQKFDHNKSPNQKSAEESWRHHLTKPKSQESHMQHHAHHHSHHQSHQSDSVHDSHWAHENKHFAFVKAAENFKKDILSEEYNMPTKQGTHDGDTLEYHSHGHVSARRHPSLSQPIRHEMNVMPGGHIQQSSQPSMREAREGFQPEHMFRWQPSHEVSRTAYGGNPTSSSGGGAVGVFPNANTGGCGIPLLLSCSPSVVSGSLAKSHPVAPPSYSAPSYRTEDDFGFLNKRDVKKLTDGRSTKILRKPVVTKQKATTLLETKI